MLRGGPSSEREISLVSGRAVAAGLRESGHDVFESDISPDDLSALDRPCDVVFPVLHGAFGEDGQVQSILESRSIPFVGSGSHASALAIDKLATKRKWIEAGIPTPTFHVATRADPTPGPIVGPCVVKSLRSGSSIGVHVIASGDANEIARRIDELVSVEGVALIEEFVRGVEITVGVLHDRTLPAIRIVYDDGFFDFTSKYGTNGATHSFDTTLPDPLIHTIGQTVLGAHRLIGCRDLSRTDVMIDASGRFYLLEINTLPGFTPRSLLPEAAGRAGIPFAMLVDQLVRVAAERGPRVERQQ